MVFSKLELYHWPIVQENLHAVLCEDTKGIVATTELGVILGAAVFDNWTRTAVGIHIWVASPLVIRHGFLNEICDYVFNTCDRKMMVGQTPANNQKAVKFNCHVGMKEVFRVKDGFDEGVDYIITRMDKKDCRWLNGKEVHSGSS